MCGIAGAFRVSGSGTVRIQDVARMNAVMKHRGPDDEGLVGVDWSGRCYDCFGVDTPEIVRRAKKGLEGIDSKPGMRAALGHRRLSIVDTSPAGHQPMHEGSQRLWISYNGEVYNFIELRSELEALGRKFDTGTDTEVILAAYQAWGPECLGRFNGMWAIAILDLENERLFLARDRFGVKPLYYAQIDGTLLFASEIKAILAYPGFRSAPNMSYLRAFLALGALEFEAETAFEGVRRFPPASYAVVNLRDAATALSFTQFWKLYPNTSRESFNAARCRRIADDYYCLLKEAVRLRLRSDVAVGSALSGGLDSSAVVYLVNQLLRESGVRSRQVAFSTVHRNPASADCDESQHISRMVSELDIESHVIEPDPAEIPRLHEKAVWCLECPCDGTGMPGMYVFRLARAHGVAVTLDGQGADEQQAGYFNYFTQQLASQSSVHILRQVVGRQSMDGAGRFMRLGAGIGLLRSVMGRDLFVRTMRTLGKNVEPYLRPLNQCLVSDCYRGLSNLIHYADSRSMIYSVESRMPFLDYRLAEFTADVPASYKIHSGWTKYFARQAFDGKLPDSITWRRDKLGWPMPDQYWLSGPLRAWSGELVAGSSLVKELCGQGWSVTGSVHRIRQINLAQWERVFWSSSRRLA